MAASPTIAGPGSKPAARQTAGIAAALAMAMPFVLAVFFGLWSMRGVASTVITDTDAARHAMNGAFIYDLIRTGHVSQAMQYAKEYYGHLPALSMPYHPPLFPAVEALAFALFGVSLATARALEAFTVAVCVILYYRLLMGIFRSHVLTASVVVTVFSLYASQLVATDVMLEFPCLLCCLAATYCLRDMERGLSGWQAVGFAVFASAAFWTKQHAVFLGAVPLVYAVLLKQWRLLLNRALWFALIVFGCAVMAFNWLASHFNAAGGVDQVSKSPGDVKWILLRTIPQYYNDIRAALEGFAGVFAICAVAALIWGLWKRSRPNEGLQLLFAWVISYAALLLVLGQVSPRYLFFAYVATVPIGYAWLYRLGVLLWGKRGAMAMVAAFAAAWFFVGIRIEPEYLRGPAQAAAIVVNGSPTRVLYAGDADGNFIFAVRTRDSDLHTTVVPGGKLPRSTFEPSALATFCREFGIDWVVIERTGGTRPWNTELGAVPEFLKLERSIPVTSSRSRWRTGTIDVYRVARSTGTPSSVLSLPIPKLRGSVEVHFQSRPDAQK